MSEKYFPSAHHADDLDRLARAVLEIAADGVLGMEEAPGKFPIHNRNGRGLGGVAKTYVASGEQWSFSSGKVSGRDVVIVGVKCPV